MNKNEDVIEVLERVQEILRGNSYAIFDEVNAELVHTHIKNENGNEIFSINLELAPTSLVPYLWEFGKTKNEED